MWKGFIVFFWRATDFILSHRVLRNACRNIRLLTIHTNHPGKNFLHKHGFIRFGRVGRIARTMYKHTEKSRKLSRFQSQPIYFQKLSKWMGRTIWLSIREFSPVWREGLTEKRTGVKFQASFTRKGRIVALSKGIWETFVCTIRNPGFWNPEYSSRNPESKFYSQIKESTAWNPESKTVLDSLAWGDERASVHAQKWLWRCSDL